MTTTSSTEEADLLAAAAWPDRPYYDTGVLLGADDFRDEQTYHRARLARALAYGSGGGTVAGLRVVPEADAAGTRHELKVLPGLAIDRLGRLIEVPRAWCLRLENWFGSKSADALRGAHGPDGVIADLFVRFAAVTRGRTPSFAQGAFDATDALVPNRLRDAFRFELLLRPDAKNAPATDFLPRSRFATLAARPADERAARLPDELLDGWRSEDPAKLAPLAEHGVVADPLALFLARIRIPVLEAPADVPPGSPPTPDFAALVAARIDNRPRRFAIPSDALAALLGL